MFRQPIHLLSLKAFDAPPSRSSNKPNDIVFHSPIMPDIFMSYESVTQVRSKALKLIQEWGIAFQSDMSLAYTEAYGRWDICLIYPDEDYMKSLVLD